MPDLAEENLTTLAGKVILDSEKLVGQQIELFRTEVGQEFQQIGQSATALAVGVSLASGGAMLVGFMLGELLHAMLNWPLWCGHGLAGFVFVAGALVFIRIGQNRLSQVQILPPQTAEAIKENLTWLKKQIKGPGT